MEKEKKDDIEIVIGDDSNLEISDVGDIVNTLRPKNKKVMDKKVIIPKTKNEKTNKQ